MRVLVTGINGLLGYDVWQAFEKKHEIFGCDNSEKPDFLDKKQWLNFDITDEKITYETITKVNPDLVLHLAAYSDVDGCEKRPDVAYRVNASGTRNIAVACQRFDTAMCYISTDYVFDGDNTPEEGYGEADRTNPCGVYGKSKYMGEYYVRHLLNKFYIVRTAWLFGSKRNNFVTGIVNSVKENKKITVVRDQTGSPTYTKDLAEALLELVEKPLYGVYHITNSGWTDRVGIVNEVFKLLGEKTEVELKTRKEVFFAPRPADSRMKNLMWRVEGFKPLRTWQEAVKEFIRNK